MVHNHDVLVTTTRLDWEASTIVGLNIAYGIVEDIEFICRGTIADGNALVFGHMILSYFLGDLVDQ